jgi:flagellar biosynthesis/type III secretory pathway ATPase
MGSVTDKSHRQAAGTLRDMLATYRKNEDLILLGAYKAGADKRVDSAIAKMDAINAFLKQGTDDKSDFTSSVAQLTGMFPASAS